ncbi:hypothetical protein Cp1R7AA1_038 [Mesorhizobium phage Cp1R7A-A1]|nr:hypothetical protein Cp1R7AA1_038 [Mesorhizobium phage Cp1R7A-A1]
MSLLLKRPRPSFASAFADTVKDDVVHWIAKSEKRIGTDAYKSFIAALPPEDSSFKLLLETAMRGGSGDHDAFRIATDLRTILEWPVDQELVHVLASGVERTKSRAYRAATIAWVMETGTRFAAKPGDSVAWRGDNFTGQRTGKVVDVDRPIASGTVTDSYGAKLLILGENLIKAAA